MAISQGARKIFIIMLIISASGVIIAWKYYSYINSIEDPRVLHIKKMHLDYDNAVRKDDPSSALRILDTMFNEYGKIGHYRNSFERGVLLTDMAAVNLNIALYRTVDEDEKIKYLVISDSLLRSALYYYNNWKKNYSSLNYNDLKEKVTSDFNDINSDNKDKIVDKRISDIFLALKELDKRYSVIYTDLGIVMRHTLHQDSASVYYKKALELWEDNHVAKSNLNVLMGEKPLKRGVIEKLFPPEREK